MKYSIKSRIVIIGCIIMLALGYVIGYDISGNYYEVYIAKLSQLPVRYTIIILILYVDYLVFEGLNNYIILVRYKSIFNFLFRSAIIQFVIMSIILFAMQVPVFFLQQSNINNFVLIIFLFIVNATVIMFLFLSIIRLFNVWINNSIMSTCIFVVMFIIFDILLNHYNFHFIYNVTFDMESLFVIPFVYQSYSLILSIIFILDMLLIFVSSHLMNRKDYILKGHENI